MIEVAFLLIIAFWCAVVLKVLGAFAYSWIVVALPAILGTLILSFIALQSLKERSK